MIEKSGEQPKLPDSDPYEPDKTNAEFADNVRQAAERRSQPAWSARRSEAAQDQSGIPEDLEVNPIPPELAFLSEEEWHDAQISNPSRLIEKPLGAIKKLAGTARGRLQEANDDFNQAFERNPDSEETKKADKRLRFWNEHYQDLMSYPRIETAIHGDRD